MLFVLKNLCLQLFRHYETSAEHWNYHTFLELKNQEEKKYKLILSTTTFSNFIISWNLLGVLVGKKVHYSGQTEILRIDIKNVQVRDFLVSCNSSEFSLQACAAQVRVNKHSIGKQIYSEKFSLWKKFFLSVTSTSVHFWQLLFPCI